LLTNIIPAAAEPIKKILNKEMPFLPDVYLPGCDVRDVALAHIRAMQLEEAASQRFIVTSEIESWSFKQYATWINEEFGPKGYTVSTWQIPNFFIKLVAFFDSAAAIITPLLSKVPKYDNKKLASILNIRPITTRQSTIDLAHSLIEKGFVPNYNCNR
jgi:nucleoside-diphosphate-sugar epimerase